jgi:ubiquinone/menaquinone biosynthesis C-methylase UbiE
MSYTLYSFKTRDEQDQAMWADTSFDGLIAASKNRNLFNIFHRHLINDPLCIIEAGCGMGTWVYNIRQMGHDIIGIDYMESTIKKLKAEVPDLPVKHGDVLDLNYQDNTFDAYVSLGVIEHFQGGPQIALREASRVLKPNGLAFITVPYLSVFRRFIAHPIRDLYFLLRRIRGKEKYFWEYRYTKRELKRFLDESNFRVIDVDIDDYARTDSQHHIGLCADFFFLREKNGEIWELNRLGRILLKIGKVFSPWFFCSGVHMVAVNQK